jgi:hypothetical protein
LKFKINKILLGKLLGLIVLLGIIKKYKNKNKKELIIKNKNN